MRGDTQDQGEHGVKSAFAYLVGEKLMTYAQTAVTRPEDTETERISVPQGSGETGTFAIGKSAKATRS